MKFTDKSIKALKPKQSRYVLTENGNYGEGRLQIRVNETGTKTFRVQYHFNAKRKVMGIGTYPAIDLKAARSKHAEISELLRKKIDPQENKLTQASIAFESAAKRTIHQMLDDFNIHISTRWAESTIDRTEKLIKRNLTPYIAPDLMPEEFTIDMARDIIYRVYNRGAKEQARLVRSVLMSILKFAIDFDNSPEQYKKPNLYDIKINFIRDINFETPKNKGERWLNEDELKKVWNADDLPYYTHQYIKLALLLGGQRVNEVYGSYVSDFDLENKTFTIPASRIKVQQRGDHIVPLCDTAIAIIQELTQQQGKAGQMFPHRDNPIASAHVSTLRMAIIRWCEKNKVPNFNPRDLRRTCKTLMGKAGIDKINRDILQQHNKFDVSSVHYDRYDYMKEKMQSIEVWENFIYCAIK
ncbi:site-specific integrase [Pseudoalteromonas sp. SG43-4]|uniref:tyrosine-type recombinase/integrase n=1 Tax=Pseudoalteromonas sp. SG43-4 TaxID=2760969 RepID=UPI0016008B1A|nr:site-specific integrase [Pseudoalteromonas sp. SG43-4]MBB1432469.1 integrase arm-type DNA-binding domain-containing protein [Pseudoalteromonas sp. SG43-4]